MAVRAEWCPPPPISLHKCISFNNISNMLCYLYEKPPQNNWRGWLKARPYLDGWDLCTKPDLGRLRGKLAHRLRKVQGVLGQYMYP